MPEAGYLKCACQHCAGPIEFPVHGVGMQIDCPHCGQKTTLRRLPTAPPASPPLGSVVASSSLPPPSPPPQAAASPPKASAPPLPPTSARLPAPAALRSRRQGVVIGAVAVAVMLVLAGGAALFLHGRKAPRAGEADPGRARAVGGEKRKRPDRSNKSRLEAAGEARMGQAPSEQPSGAAAPASTREAASPKSVSQLQTGGVTLEKVTGSSLVYAVGSLTNASSHQRYDVNVYVALTDAGGKPAGTARDQRAALEPREVWRFRALVLDSRARMGAITNITEEP